MKSNKLLSVVFAFVLLLSAFISVSAQEPEAVAIDKEAFDALLASGAAEEGGKVIVIRDGGELESKKEEPAAEPAEQ